MCNDAFTVETIIGGFDIPYGIAIVSEDEYFITDRIGVFYHYKDGTLKEINRIPKVPTSKDPGIPTILYGGLMDASIHPNYSTNTWIYISYLATDAIPRVSRFKIKDNTVSQFETIFETSTPGYYGNGMRIAWQDDNHFFLNIGGTTLSTNSNPDLIAQDLNKDWGKYID